VQMGTAFLTCSESAIPAIYKQRLLDAGDHPTRLTRSFSGRYARGLDNRFMQLMAPHEQQVPPYPIQNALTGRSVPRQPDAARRNGCRCGAARA
jgi:nitronate monooxygenase